MASPLPDLITTQDTFEIVGQRLAEIIAVNAAQQAVLAVGQPDPTEWDLRVFTERKSPWNMWANLEDFQANRAPIVNVWYQSSVFDTEATADIGPQRATALYNIDIVAGGHSQDDGGTGQTPGDVEASTRLHRAARFVRQFIQADANDKLQFTATPFIIQFRRVQSTTAFDPPENAAGIVALGMRLAVMIRFEELAPVNTGETMDTIGVDITVQTETNEVLVQLEYDVT